MHYFRELFVDNFAGGGGTSSGIELAIGRSVDIAINHDPAAIAMPLVNHPETEHYNENVWDVDPREVTRERPVGLCWLSPDCKHFSKAKGGKLKEKSIRGLAWVAVRWAATVNPRVIMLENVEEFKTWGPLLKDGMPDPDKKGRTFQAFVNALKRQGYQVDYRELRACDYGAPTIRKRFFLIARCDGRPIVWPKPTHGDPESVEVKSGKLLPWRTAAEIIDWSLPRPSIFARKKPLAENTLRRIARGIQRFVIDNPRPFIVRIGQTGYGGDRLQYEVDQPLTTITTKAEHLVVTPTLGVNTSGHPGSSVDKPIRTITTGFHHMLISPTLIQIGYGEREGQQPRVLDLEKTIGTVTAGGNKFGLATAELIAVPHITKFRTGATGHGVDEPLHTVTSGAGSKRPAGAAHALGLVTSHLVKMRGTNIGQPVAAPLQTITAGGNHFGEVRAFLMAYYGSSVGQKVDEPLGTVTTRDRFGLVTIHGQDYQIVDIGMRILEPHELFAAEGFPDTYIIDRDAGGKSYPKSAQVARCGNSVPPPFAEALVRANLPEHCAGAGNVAVFERYKEQPAGQLALSI
ncbi:DNA cytosine methyltransferase [Brevibacillus sp. NPDC003359]|uniref:DNA cytosine methyltransferase n=1 Tax=unclassified Brevibacillus TaxID=2684853 RepID=UPI003693C083